MPAPTLHTPRLTLRPHVLADMEPFWEFYQSDRAAYISGPRDRGHFWYGFTSEVGTWDLCGYGGWAVDLKGGGFVGQVAIIQPPAYPELEIGWILFDGHEGKGYAAEAVTAALHWAWENLSIDTLVSYIDPANTRSRALAERLGAVQDPAAALPQGDTAEDTLVYRHSPDADGSPEAYA
ncbi:GNAT family N-acetyltransferase [Mameliella sediminis]|uniref:GNAT family N-acetyltransferase n=1 Tax=Mameliella sediminis TaxID=2836866 RepID=UPI001C47A069|nr:GNAT family N-acetyltransferase [Mameliella sediminis]MBY6113674.1 GNAT family N-acetyltransferase [Antarctobacter heliothermus]MBY6142978.1 GNAT family N-acetyltransferase [Mameliella alba]MBV7394971.1 GNAT family N-acetyltransferase [Mameliella sediminis]MBY6159833.1 GNAT family N-acetyltransferase [Mameliella alba]MBY6168304.1 GNAT family N-acetyltransferase [Mameliella alba]